MTTSPATTAQNCQVTKAAPGLVRRLAAGLEQQTAEDHVGDDRLDADDDEVGAQELAHEHLVAAVRRRAGGERGAGAPPREDAVGQAVDDAGDHDHQRRPRARCTAAHTTATSAIEEHGEARHSARERGGAGHLESVRRCLLGGRLVWHEVLRDDRAGDAGAGPRQRMRRAALRQLRALRGLGCASRRPAPRPPASYDRTEATACGPHRRPWPRPAESSRGMVRPTPNLGRAKGRQPGERGAT